MASRSSESSLIVLVLWKLHLNFDIEFCIWFNVYDLMFYEYWVYIWFNVYDFVVLEDNGIQSIYGYAVIRDQSMGTHYQKRWVYR